MIFIRVLCCIVLMSFSFFHCERSAANNTISSIISDEISRQINITPVILKFGHGSTIPKTDNVQLISVLVNDGDFSAMLRTNTGEVVLNGRYFEAVQVPVLRHSVNTDDIIERYMLTNQLFIANRVNNKYLLNADDIVGKVAKRRIAPNKGIRNIDVGEQLLVRRGDAVMVRYVDKNMMIETHGVSMENGSKGAMLKVKNSDSGIVMSGKIVSSGIIEVGCNR